MKNENVLTRIKKRRKEGIDQLEIEDEKLINQNIVDKAYIEEVKII